MTVFKSEPAAVRVVTDLAYAPQQPATSLGHLLDLYLPAAEGQGPFPLVLWSHGSAWFAENGRDGAEVVASHLNPLGFAVAGIAIRSSTHAHFPAQLYDVKAAIRWLRANAREYNLDPARFGIMGESSGGWTAAMAAVTGDVPELEGDVGLLGPSSRVQAAVPIYPPTDFLQMDAHMLEGGVAFNQMLGLTHGHADPGSPESRLVGGPIEERVDAVRRANPITYVHRDVPPFLILHGQRDLLVPFNQGELLYEALRAAGAHATFVSLPRGEHGHWNEYLSDPAISGDATVRSSHDEPGELEQPVSLNWQMIGDFFAQHL